MTRQILRRAFVLLRFILFAQIAQAQKPVPVPPVLVQYYSSAFVGPVASLDPRLRGGQFLGFSLGAVLAHRTLRALTFPGFDLEVGAIRPIQQGASADGLFSFNLQPTWITSSNRLAPYVTVGYSRIFLSGNAINFGTGVNIFPKGLKGTHFLRLEARDYYTFASDQQHLVTLHLAFCFAIPDV